MTFTNPHTPETVSELLELNKNQKEELTPEQVLEVVEQLTPLQTIHLTRLFLSRLENFHWSVVEDINEGEKDAPLQPWVHDATLISNCLMMYQNMTDFNDEEE